MLQIKSAKYLTGAATYSQCVVSEMKQIAFCGKSNVGKSSFINMLTNDGKLARTSKLPGRTRLVNYFVLNEKQDPFLLVDLPGYGFAKVSQSEKQKWSDLLEKYLANEPMLAHVFFLVDIRHEPTKDDAMMYNYLFKNNVPFTLIATKADKISKSQQQNRKNALASYFKLGKDNVIAISSETRLGKEKVLERIENVLSIQPIEQDDKQE